MVKDNINLDGVKETMLIPLYARAWASKRKNPRFVDEVALKVIDNIDYNFDEWKSSKMNIWGCAGRTIILDTLTREHIMAHPNCTIVNLASGLDDRFSRVDNGKIQWINIDFPEIINLRANIIEKNERVLDLPMSMFDYSWIEKVQNKEHLLVIMEGVLMYIEEEKAIDLFHNISNSFKDATLLLELMTRWMVDNQKFHDVTKKTDNKFVWGVKTGRDIEKFCKEYKFVEEYNITDSMKIYSKFFIPLISKILAPKNNRIVKYKVIK